MKLSPKRKFGHVHVRADRLVKVVKEHRVDARGNPQANRGVPKRSLHGGFAQEGDLALELYNVKTKKIVGYSYLTGNAIQAICYRPPERVYAEAQLAMVELPTIQDFETPQPYMDAMAAVVLGVKYGEIDVGVFKYSGRGLEDAKNVANIAMQMYSYVRDDDADPRGHLLGIIRGGGSSMLVHCQPPRHASDYSATIFQAELAVGLGRQQKRSAS